jgi:hypothetical protein
MRNWTNSIVQEKSILYNSKLEEFQGWGNKISTKFYLSASPHLGLRKSVVIGLTGALAVWTVCSKVFFFLVPSLICLLESFIGILGSHPLVPAQKVGLIMQSIWSHCLVKGLRFCHITWSGCSDFWIKFDFCIFNEHYLSCLIVCCCFFFIIAFCCRTNCCHLNERHIKCSLFVSSPGLRGQHRRWNVPDFYHAWGGPHAWELT